MTRPLRAGQKWGLDEIRKLLTSIQLKKSIEDIAIEHQRTTSSIYAMRRKLAVDYYLKDKKSFEEIESLLGLTKSEIEDAIKMYEAKKLSYTVVPKPVDTTSLKARPVAIAGTTDNASIVSILKEISSKLDIIIDRLSPASGAGDTGGDVIKLE